MRKRIHRTPTAFTTTIEEIQVDLDSRDHIPRVVRTLQEIWMRPDDRNAILGLAKN